jgi:uncharacterized membrane protein YdjX (TVP38/TMEM64 family)
MRYLSKMNFYIKNKNTVLIILILTFLPFIGSSFYTYILYENTIEISHFSYLEKIILYSILSITMAFALTPTTITAFCSGYIFGWEAAPFIVFSYSIAQYIGYKLIQLFDNKNIKDKIISWEKSKNIVSNINEHQSKTIFFARLSPIIPFAVANVLFGILNVNLSKFMLWGVFGMIPRTTLVIFLGIQSKSILEKPSQNIFYQVSTVLLTLIALWGMKFIFKKKE